LLLRGDTNKLNEEQRKMDSHEHATDLQEQVNNFNKGIALDGTKFTPPEEPFSYGMACYPEKHAESPNMESEIFYTKMKVDNGAEYLVPKCFSIIANILNLLIDVMPKGFMYPSFRV